MKQVVCVKSKAVVRKDAELLYSLLKIFSKKVVGNEDILLVLLNKLSLRLVENANPISSNLVVGGLTGVGKDFIVGYVSDLILPDGCCFHKSYMTDKVLIYWSQEIDWNSKVLWIEDPSKDMYENDILKVMSSGGLSAVVCMGQDVVNIEIKGKPCIVFTSMRMSLDVEKVRRFDILNVNYDPIVVKAVLKSIASESKLSYSAGEMDLLNSVKSLGSMAVSVSFESKLAEVLPNNLIMPTLFRKLLDYIRASAVLHGHNRATWFDYEYARFCFWRLNNLGIVPLNIIEKEFVNILRESAFPLKVSEIVSRFSHSRKWIETHVDRLKELGVIEELVEFDKPSNREVLKYSSKSVGVFNLPSSVVLSGSSSAFLKFSKLLKDLDNDRISIGLKSIFGDFLKLP